MNKKTQYLAFALLLAVAPGSFAHEGGYGAPKTECELTLTQTDIHEYGPGAGSAPFVLRDGSTAPCMNHTQVTWDGHYEYNSAGAILLAQDPGAIDCYGTFPDHLPAPFITVYDLGLQQLGSSVSFSVYADSWNNLPIPPDDPNCGDFETDSGRDCVDHCQADFAPGLDGSYQVFVRGTTGHILATSSAPMCNDWLRNLDHASTAGRNPACNNIQVWNDGTATVTFVFAPTGTTCSVPPGSTTCPWGLDVFVASRGGSQGTWKQTS